jgi:hypothetical protein
MLYVIKGFFSLKIVEYIWLQCMAYMLCPKVVFPTKKIFTKDVLHALVQKKLKKYVHLALANCMATTYTFDL